jgi:UPF0716 protein FxsA
MPLLFLLLFISLPIAELAVLIKVSQVINLGPTLLLVVFNSMLGLYLLRQQGLSSLRRVQQALDQGRLPVEGVIDGFGLMIAAALLVTPGLITDAMGFLLLVRPVRHFVGRWLVERAARSKNVRIDILGMSSRRSPSGPGRDGFHRQSPFPSGPGARETGRGPVIEGEIIEPDRDTKRPDDSGSPWRQ